MAQPDPVVTQLKNIGALFGLQTAIASVPRFSGSTKAFKTWIKAVEHASAGVEGGEAERTIVRKVLTQRTADGAVADYLLRLAVEHPQFTWPEYKQELTTRFGEVVDKAYAKSVLRKCKQKADESVYVYAERILDLAQDAYTAAQLTEPVVNAQLVEYFTDGLKSHRVARKVLREQPANFRDAIDVAGRENEILKQFSLRNRDDTPMEVDKVEDRGRFKGNCYSCGKSGHMSRDCRVKKKPGVGMKKKVVCFKCKKQGHYKSECPEKDSADS